MCSRSPYTPWACAPCRQPVTSHRRANATPIFTSSCGPPGTRLSVRFPAAAAAPPPPPPPRGIRSGGRFASKNLNVSSGGQMFRGVRQRRRRGAGTREEDQEPQPRLLDGDIVEKDASMGETPPAGSSLTSPRCPSAESPGLLLRRSGTQASACGAGKEKRRDGSRSFAGGTSAQSLRLRAGIYR